MQEEPPLERLRDIHLPPDPAFWPPAPGWWVVAAFVIGLSVLLVVAARTAARRRRPRREALRCIARIDERLACQASPAAVSADIAVLLRRVALNRFTRPDVAGLTGLAWLEFLRDTGGGEAFTVGVGRHLLSAPYAPAEQFDAAALLELSEEWIRKNT